MRQSFAPYRGMMLKDFEVQNQSQAEAVITVGSYIEGLDHARMKGKGLTLLGPNGVGKTMFANIVINAAHDLGYRVEAIELASYVGLHKEKWDIHDLLAQGQDDVIDAYIKVRSHIRYIQGHLTKSADWVLFDDVGREFPSQSGWSQNEFFDTLRFRWNRGLPFLLTTNLPLSELERRYTEGFTSLIAEATEIILVEGDDYRWRKGNWELRLNEE